VSKTFTLERHFGEDDRAILSINFDSSQGQSKYFVVSIQANHIPCVASPVTQYVQVPHFSVNGMEFAAQVGAMLGASAILYYVTKPHTTTFDIEELSDRSKLKGCFRYSHYHRQKSLHSMYAKHTSTFSEDSSSSSSVVSNGSGHSE
jgi:hypothetical protein